MRERAGLTNTLHMPVNYNPIPAYAGTGIFSPEYLPAGHFTGFTGHAGMPSSPGYPNPINMKMNQRLFIYPADLVLLTGKSVRSCYRMYRTLLDCVGKDPKKRQKLTFKEYCTEEGLDETEVRKHLNLI